MKKAFDADEKVFEGEEVSSTLSTTSLNFKTIMKQKAHKMKCMIQELDHTVSNLSYAHAVSALIAQRGMWSSFKDDCERTVLHIAVEMGLHKLAKFSPNVWSRCKRI